MRQSNTALPLDNSKSPVRTRTTARDLLAQFGFSPLGFALVLLLFALPYLPIFSQEHYLRWLIMGAFLAAQAVAFDFTAGYINVVNFGFAAILGLGAYTSAVLANTSPVLALQLGISPWIGIFAGALVAAVVGFGLGILTLRLRGIYAAVMAWFVGLPCSAWPATSCR
jgi:branched-chain amino acid transport system permease protein